MEHQKCCQDRVDWRGCGDVVSGQNRLVREHQTRRHVRQDRVDEGGRMTHIVKTKPTGEDRSMKHVRTGLVK